MVAIYSLVRIISYGLLSSALFLILLSGPLPLFLAIYYDYQLLDLFKSWGIAVELRGLAITIFSLLCFTLGMAIRFPLTRFLELNGQLLTQARLPSLENKILKLYFLGAILLTGLAVLGDLGALSLVFIMFLFASTFNDSSNSFATLIVPVELLTGAGLLIGHMVVASLIGRFHWLLLRKLT